MTTTYGLYVPVEGERTSIQPASAIVGDLKGDTVHVHYEGSKRMSFDERIIHAAGRRQQSYPTIAQSWLPAERLVRVGSVERSDHLKTWIVTEITDAATLEKWAGTLPVIGGSPEARGRAAGMAWSRLSVGVQASIHMKVQAGGDMTDLILAETAR